MATYLHPGVYVEEIPSGSKPIEGVDTSVAAFIGYTTKGPIGEPVRITKYDDYKQQFGGIQDMKTSTKGDPMGLSVLAFFQNGGTKTYIVRITKDWKDPNARDAVKATGYMDHPSPLNTTQAIKFTAVNEGKWANGLVATLVQPKGAAPNTPLTPPYTLAIGTKNTKGELETRETFPGVSVDENDPQFIGSVVNGFSELVEVALVPLQQVPLLDVQPPAAGAFVGTSTSGPITATFPLDLTAADDDHSMLSIRLDAEAAATGYPIDKTTYNALEDVGVAIQDAVRAGATSQQGFTASVVNGRLVLTSGTHLPASAVEVGPSGLAETLSLGTSHGGHEVTGAVAARATEEAVWSSTTAPALKEATLRNGDDGHEPGTSDYGDVFSQFVKYRDINIIALPGQSWSTSGNDVISAAIAHAEEMKSRVVIVDPPADTELKNPKNVTDLGLPTSTYSVLYYPWVKVSNPFYNAETNPGPPTAVLVPPSGFAAGMWSKIDARRGVWKAPAGVETGLLGVAGLEYVIENGEQDVLNPLGVNALRSLPGFGSVIWGARTLSTKADPEWRYVPVRRTAIMIEQSIYNGIQWAVFEPNDHRLWSALRANIGGFMDGLFRSGAFQGEKASDAYFVRCRLGDTMTQDDIDAGRVIVIVGFAPLKPAEFVIVRIQQKVAQQ